MLKTVNVDRVTLVDELFPMFKEHLRILDNFEDDLIKLYLGAAIGGIHNFVDQDIFKTDYSYEDFGEYELNNIYRAYSGNTLYVEKENIFDVVIKDKTGTDVTSDYKIDEERGYIHPTPIFHDIFTFSSGYVTYTDIPDFVKITIYRYGATLFENRETTTVAAAKDMPDWVNYALSTLRKQKV